ncbi:diguanylate cyclase domain-containing protein [Endozoicomonas arenosclerae]|uniref:diguanylate cyclase domain-containing protein n=1 Tax=Endozoicomonas arenosclerae TaxID=1633495 RepID=UPI0007836C63|nr:diguanylate cyclase [Endozoicomonas arenosclerae]
MSLFKQSNYAPLFFSLLLLLALVSGLLIYTPKTLKSFAEHQAIINAQKEVEKVRVLIDFYDEQVISKVRTSDDFHLGTQPMGDKKQLPVPFTFIVELGQAYGDLSDNFSVYSPYPFEGRKRNISDFDREAWAVLSKGHKSFFLKREMMDGKEWVNIALPQSMTSSVCTGCHNVHPQSVKKDWQVGDIRAVFKTRVSLSTAQKKGHEIAKTVSAGLGLVFFLSVILFLFFFSRKKSEDSLRDLALVDQMTHLQNKFAFQAALADLVQQRSPGYLLYLDLDGFKGVNDTFGHAAGDRILEVVSDRMASAARNMGEAFRLGGDEFAIIVDQFEDKESIRRLCDWLLASIAQPVQFQGQALSVGLSMGIAFNDGTFSEADDWVKRADQAMYRSKEAGKNRYTFAE